MPSEVILPATEEATSWIAIDFQRYSTDPGRVFRAMDAMIRALASADRSLLAGFGLRVTTEPMLVDIQAGSIRTRLASLLRDIPDDVLAKGEIRPLIGHFLVRSKRRLLKAVEEGPSTDFRVLLPRVQLEIAAEARQTDIVGLGYTPPTVPEIAEHIRSAARAVQQLRPGDRMVYEANGDAAFLDPARPIDEDALEEAISTEQLRSTARMILKVKRPDFLGDAQWDFRHGSEVVRARIVDDAWLSMFRSRQASVQPGDALDAEVLVVAHYGPAGDLIRTAHTILRVLRVVPGGSGQGELSG